MEKRNIRTCARYNYCVDKRKNLSKRCVVVGGGPAGLMAAETILKAGAVVDLFDHNPTMGRKLLIAGSSGLNLSKDEAWVDFLSHYGEKENKLTPILSAFDQTALTAWVKSLGIKTFTGSSGKIFPVGMKAGAFFHAWMERLSALGLTIHPEHDWLGWGEKNQVRFKTPTGECAFSADAVVLALGGASWPQTGSDGNWVKIFTEAGVTVAPLKPANCGFEVNWSPVMKKNYAGEAIKTVTLFFTDVGGQMIRHRGEFVLTEYGVEGNLIYQAGAKLRDSLKQGSPITIILDLMPDWTEDRIVKQFSQPRGKRSWSSFLARTLGLSKGKLGLVFEILAKEEFESPTSLALKLKALPLQLIKPRPLAEAISTAGGVAFEGLGDDLMLKKYPGVFCAGEMLDWEAPTGGYLIHACLATGHWAGLGAVKWLEINGGIYQE